MIIVCDDLLHLANKKMTDPFFQTGRQTQQNPQNNQQNGFNNGNGQSPDGTTVQGQNNMDQSPNTQQSLADQGQVQQVPSQNTVSNQQQPQRTNPTQTKKKGSRISMKGFLLGCIIFIIIFVGLAAGGLYFILQNPDQMASVGLDRETVTTLLQTFTVLFFGFLIFAGFGVLATNVYRLFTVKNKSKFGYIVGSLLGFILLGGSFAGAVMVLRAIENISVNTAIDSDRLLVPYITLQSGPRYIYGEEPVQLIAPTVMSYAFNANLFNTQVMPTLGPVDVTSVTLQCPGNKTLSLDFGTMQFQGVCLYQTKGQQPLSITITYTNRQSGERGEQIIDAGSLNIVSEIDITPTNQALRFNDTATELIAGQAPAKVAFDATQVFTDFGLPEFKIIWDVDGDEVIDREDATQYTHTYQTAKLHTVNVRFPRLNNYIYAVPLRVLQSDVPICDVQTTLLQGTEYEIGVSFIENNVNISQYAFTIIDKDTDTELDTIRNTQPQLGYSFPGGGLYAVRVDFVTDEGKQGRCESPDIQVGATDFTVDYTISYKTPDAPQFQEVGDNSDVTLVNNTLTITELPTIVQLAIDRISPDTPGTNVKVTFNSDAVLSTDGETYELRVSDTADQEATIEVIDTNREMKTTQTIVIRIKQDDIIGKLLIKPDTVGTDPFTVQFDASTTTINDPDDEIVFFTWDFGDGEVKQNVPQAIVRHTYTYDYDEENGTYEPAVTIVTKKGREVTIVPDNNIIVKKPIRQATIRVDSHPAQVAPVGAKVDVALEIDGLPITIFREFGNGKTLECNGRECIETSVIYDTPGTYPIKVRIDYEDQPSIDGQITMKVE